MQHFTQAFIRFPAIQICSTLYFVALKKKSRFKYMQTDVIC